MPNHPKSESKVENHTVIRNQDNAEWFAKKAFQMRDDLRGALGDEYLRTVQPIMDGLREDAGRQNISVLKVFESAATPFLDGKHTAQLWLLGAAVAELYLLRENLFPGIRRDG